MRLAVDSYITVCMLCRAYLGGFGDSAHGLSHGICAKCGPGWIAEGRRELERVREGSDGND